MAWYKVAPPDSNEGAYIQKVKAGGKTICLVKEQSHVYALGAICPHAGADLSKGWCEQGKLVCPYHRYAYDLGTGRGDVGQNDYVNSYKTEIRADGIYVEVLSLWERIAKAIK